MKTQKTRLDEPFLASELLSRLRPDPSNPLPKVRQLYLSFYEAIEQGDLAFDTRLPSTRDLAMQLSLGRNTVISVYEQLVADGLLSADGRRGTRVARQVKSRSKVGCTPVHRSVRSQSIRSQATSFRALSPGEPDTTLFPQSIWRKAESNAARTAGHDLGYRLEAMKDTREAIARYLANYRSLQVAPEQIVVTSGTRQSLLLAASLFADHGDTAWVECPGYLGAVDAFKQMGLNLRPCGVDEQGFRIPENADPPPRLIYLTPCFQYPYGMSLSAERRHSILELSRQHGSVVFEDDYDSEFRSDAQPRPSLAANSDSAFVLNAGTFSKLLFPAIRVGWLVVPKSITRDAYIGLKALGGGNNTISQLVVTELLNNGSVSRHLKHARQIYSQRCATLIQALSSCDMIEPIERVSGSLSLVVRLKRSVSINALEASLAQQELGIQPLERMDWSKSKPKRSKAVVMGLGNVDSLTIPTMVNRFELALRAAL